jgi:tetratricopeptide (TPR) repeat protein
MIASDVRRRPAGASALMIAVLCFAVLAAGAHPASAASEAEREARSAFESAESHFRAGEFADALADYQAGYQASPLPGFLVNIAQCERRLGDLKKARATYQKFVIVAPDSPLVPQVKGLINELDRLLADLDDDKPAKPTAPSDGESSTGAPAPTTQRLDLRDGVAASPAADALLVATPAPPAEKPASRRRWWLWAGIGTAVACGVVTAFLLAPGASTVHDGSLGTLRR